MSIGYRKEAAVAMNAAASSNNPGHCAEHVTVLENANAEHAEIFLMASISSHIASYWRICDSNQTASAEPRTASNASMSSSPAPAQK